MKGLVPHDGRLTLAQELPRPDPGRDQVLVRVHYASLNPTDLDLARGSFDWLLKLLRRTSPVRTGLEFSGVVMTDGPRFAAGDEVFGYPNLVKGPKTHQEYLAVSPERIALVPDSIGLAEAAGLPVGAQTSLEALRRVARLTAGHRVLLYGASGGVGVYAIQIAKALGLQVTAVAGPAGQEVMRALGADEVADYTATPIQQLAGPFDCIFDLSTTLKYREIEPLLAEHGTFIPADPLASLTDLLTGPIRNGRTGYLMVAGGNHRLLNEIADWVDADTIKAQQSRVFALDEVDQAIAALQTKGGLGRVVLRMPGASE